MEKSVTMQLAPMTFVVTGNTQKEHIENAKKMLIEQLKNGTFPHVTYSINESNVLTHSTIYPGLIVETSSGDKGIVSVVNKTKVNVTLTGGRKVTGAPQAFRKSTATFEEARSVREFYMKNIWLEGDTGYIKVGDEICEVVVGKKAGTKRKLSIVNGQQYLSLSEDQINTFLKDEKSEIQNSVLEKGK